MGINNKNYSNGSTSEVVFENNTSGVDTKSRAINMAKVYIYLAVQLLITGVVAFGLGALFAWWMSRDYTNAKNTLNILTIISGLICVILCFGIAGSLTKSGKLVKPLVIVYNVLMGLLISTLTIWVDWRILGMAFGITTAIFFVDAIIGMFAKGNMNWIAFAATTMLVGAGIMALVTWPFAIFMNSYNPSMVSLVWAIDIIFFVAINLITLVDIVRLNKIAERGKMEDNLALYCAFTIYVDFIYIFVRLVMYLAIATRR